MARNCVCGMPITVSSRLCNECLEKYGKNPKKWPDWVKFLVSEEQKEANRERRHKDLVFDEETIYPLSDEAAHNLARAKKHPEMDFEDFAWQNQ